MTDRIERSPNWAEKIVMVDTGVPDHTATLAAWLLFRPGHSPAWGHYVLAAIHLRPIEGVKPPHLDFPGAEHEIMMMALDPQTCPVGLGGHNYLEKQPAFLTPGNYRDQVAGVSDEHVIRLTEGLARALVHGYLPAEPQGIIGAREMWRNTIFNTLEHFTTGGHRTAPARDA